LKFQKKWLKKKLKHAKENVEQQAKQYGLEMDMFLSLSGVDKENLKHKLEES
jgi:hypothetical protein